MNNTKPKVVVTDYAFPDLNTEQQILTDAGCEVVGRQCKTEADLIDLCRDADAVLTQFARVNEGHDAVFGVGDVEVQIPQRRRVVAAGADSDEPKAPVKQGEVQLGLFTKAC